MPDFSKIREKVIQLFIKSTELVLVVITVPVFANPKNPNFLYSVLPWQNIPILIIFAVFELLLLFHTLVTCKALFSFVFYFIFTTKFWLKKIIELR
jgi:hypothetical protein